MAQRPSADDPICPDPTERRPLTVEQVFGRYVERRRDCRSIDTIRGRAARLVELLGADRPIEAVGVGEVERLTDHLVRTHRARRTAKHYCVTLRVAIGELVRRGELTFNPAMAVPLPVERDADLEWRDLAYFEIPELDELLNDELAPRKYFPRAALAVQAGYWLLAHGMRQGEQAALRWCDYDTRRHPLGALRIWRQWHTTKRAFADPKVAAPKLCPAPAAGLAAFLAWWRAYGWGYVFGRDPLAEDLIAPAWDLRGRPVPWRNDRQRKELLRDLDWLGLRKRSVHDLRRTWLSWVLDAGAEWNAVRRITHARPTDTRGKYQNVPYPTLCRQASLFPVIFRARDDRGHGGSGPSTPAPAVRCG